MKYEIASNRPFEGKIASNPTELLDYLKTNKVERIYFPFWSWRVPVEILQKYECIGFHTAPLPLGRGGSPIQNMIRLGYNYSELCAFKMVEGLDEGEVLLRHPVSLEGNLQSIISRINDMIIGMINDIETNHVGHNVLSCDMFKDVPAKFDRITSNKLLETDTIKQLHDEIRMRDEHNHPKAYLYHGKYIIEFMGTFLKGEELTANVRIFI